MVGGLLGLALLLTSCGSVVDSSVSPSPPLITDLVFPDTVQARGSYAVTLAYVVPSGIPESPAVQLAWSLGGGLPLVVESLSAAAIGCVAGQSTCSTTFTVSQPPPLLTSESRYVVTISVRDRLGETAARQQSVFLSN